MFRIQQGDTLKYLAPPPNPRGKGNALSRRTDGRRAKRGRALANGGEADLGAPAVGGEVDPDAPLISGEAKATGALTSPAALAGAHNHVPLTSIIVQHASSAPVFTDKSPDSRSLWVKLMSRPRGESNFQERAAAVAR